VGNLAVVNPRAPDSQVTQMHLHVAILSYGSAFGEQLSFLPRGDRVSYTGVRSIVAVSTHRPSTTKIKGIDDAAWPASDDSWIVERTVRVSDP
jgi:hypothetical protein